MLVHGESHGTNTFVVQGQTRRDALMERLGRLSGRVDVACLLRLHVALFVIDGGFNHAIADSLGHNVLGRFLRLQTQTDANVSQRDSAVAEGQSSDSRANDILAQAKHQCVCTVTSEDRRKGVDQLQEAMHLTSTYRLDELEVGFQGIFELWLAEERTFGDIAHEQLDDHQEFHRGLVEANRHSTGGSFASGAGELLMCLCVGKLDCSDAAKVEHVSRDLIVWGCLGKLGLRDESIRLSNVRRCKVVAKEEDNDGGLCIFVFSKNRALERGEERPSDFHNRRLSGWGLGFQLLIE